MKKWLLFLSVLAATETLRADTIWYHPNPWWHVATDRKISVHNPFPYRWIAPQFSYPHKWTGTKWETSDWPAWMAANQMTKPHQLNGHSWQAFIAANAEVLKQHPEWLAEINGVRVGYGKTNKLCVSNPGLQKAFVAWTVARFAELHDPTGFVSVEPSDGAGQCDCADCRRMGSISDRVFSLANLAAAAVAQKFPRGGVNLYAYYEHADTPRIQLRPNVHVTVIPNGFQDLYDGDVLLYAWRKKTSNLSYYDYIAIPQWKGELPRINAQDFVRRINIARKLGYQGFWHEVGLSLPAALSIQLMSQLWLDDRLDWNTVFDRFVADCFPHAQVPMKRLFSRWFNEWNGDQEVVLAAADIREAESKRLSPEEKKRLSDIKAYVVYIAAYQNWQKDPAPAATSTFFSEISSITDRQLVNYNALEQLFGARLKDAAQQKKYAIQRGDDWKWMRVKSERGLDRCILAYAKEFAQRSAPEAKQGTGFNPVRILPNGATELAIKYAQTVGITGTGKTVRIHIKGVDFADDKDGKQYVSVVAADGTLIRAGFLPLDTDLSFDTVSGMEYRLSVKQIFNAFVTGSDNKVRLRILSEN